MAGLQKTIHSQKTALICISTGLTSPQDSDRANQIGAKNQQSLDS